MTAILKDRFILSSERMLHKDYESKCLVGIKLLVVSLKGLVAKKTPTEIGATENSSVFWDVTPCTHSEGNRRFGGLRLIHLQG
jgi:hypothetical protein